MGNRNYPRVIIETRQGHGKPDSSQVLIDSTTLFEELGILGLLPNMIRDSH